MMIDVQRRFDLPATPDELIASKNALYLEIAREATVLYPEMARLLELVRARGLPVAIASGSSPGVLRTVLEAVGLIPGMEVVVWQAPPGRLRGGGAPAGHSRARVRCRRGLATRRRGREARFHALHRGAIPYRSASLGPIRDGGPSVREGDEVLRCRRRVSLDREADRSLTIYARMFSRRGSRPHFGPRPHDRS